MMLSLLFTIASICSVQSSTISTTIVNEPGFGDLGNKYAFASAVFQDKFYVATLNAPYQFGIILFFLGLPFRTEGTQIFQGTKDETDNTWTWKQVLSDGNGNKFNYGIRRFEAVNKYFYAVTSNHVTGFEIWRTTDGINWEIVMNGGFGDRTNLSGRGLFAFDGYLYVGVENRNSGAKIYRRKLQDDGDFEPGSEWQIITNDGFGDTLTFWFADFVVYKGLFYFYLF